MAPRSTKQTERPDGAEFELLPPRPSRHVKIGGESVPVLDLVDVEIEKLPRAQELLVAIFTNKPIEKGPELKKAMVEYLGIVAPALTADKAEAGLKTHRHITDLLAFLLKDVREGADPLAESRQSETSSAKAA